MWARPDDTGPFLVHTRILGPFSGLTPADGQSMGLFVGAGDQDNYAKIVVSGTGGGQIAFHTEIGGAVGSVISTPVALPGPSYIDLYLRVDPTGGTIRAGTYSVASGGVTSPQTALAGTQNVPSDWFTNPASGLAIGIISTSRGPSAEFPATWDFIRAIPDTAGPGTTVVYRVNAGGLAVSGTPNWSDDTGSPPSSHVNAETIGNNVYTTSSAVDSSHPSIPAGTPPSVLTSERYNPAENAPMQWSFPVTPGTYEYGCTSRRSGSRALPRERSMSASRGRRCSRDTTSWPTSGHSRV